jgi:hypothetical protein
LAYLMDVFVLVFSGKITYYFNIWSFLLLRSGIIILFRISKLMSAKTDFV